jgi:cytoskeletal protein RodZ
MNLVCCLCRLMDFMKDWIEFKHNYKALTVGEQALYGATNMVITGGIALIFLQRIMRPNTVQRRHYNMTGEAKAVTATTEEEAQPAEPDSASDTDYDGDASPSKATRSPHRRASASASPSQPIDSQADAATGSPASLKSASPSPSRGRGPRLPVRRRKAAMSSVAAEAAKADRSDAAASTRKGHLGGSMDASVNNGGSSLR